MSHAGGTTTYYSLMVRVTAAANQGTTRVRERGRAVRASITRIDAKLCALACAIVALLVTARLRRRDSV